MSDNFVCLSIGRPAEYAYRVYRDGCALLGTRSHRPACWWAEFYPTYGDSTVQHGTGAPVQDEMMGDFCASVAKHCLTFPDDVETVARHWPRSGPDAKEVIFLVGLRPKEGKTLYFNRRDRKVSAAESRAYDKRWERVGDHCDGTVNFICSALDLSYSPLLEVYHVWQEVKNILRDADVLARFRPDGRTGKSVHSVEEALALPENGLATAFSVLADVCRSWRSLDDARRGMECWERNRESERKFAETRAAAAAVEVSANG